MNSVPVRSIISIAKRSRIVNSAPGAQGLYCFDLNTSILSNLYTGTPGELQCNNSAVTPSDCANALMSASFD